MALGNIFSLSAPIGDGPLEKGRNFRRRVRADQDDRVRVDERSMPVGVEKEGLRQRAGRWHKHSLHLPAVKNVSPTGPELHGGLKLAQQVVAIEVGATVHEYAIFGIEFPDRIASPIVVNENSLGLGAGLQERDCLLGILLRFVGILAAGKTDPFYGRKHSNQNDN